MPKVSYPHTYFSKKKLANSQNKANFKKRSVVYFLLQIKLFWWYWV